MAAPLVRQDAIHPRTSMDDFVNDAVDTINSLVDHIDEVTKEIVDDEVDDFTSQIKDKLDKLRTFLHDRLQVLQGLPKADGRHSIGMQGELVVKLLSVFLQSISACNWFETTKPDTSFLKMDIGRIWDALDSFESAGLYGASFHIFDGSEPLETVDSDNDDNSMQL